LGWEFPKREKPWNGWGVVLKKGKLLFWGKGGAPECNITIKIWGLGGGQWASDTLGIGRTSKGVPGAIPGFKD